MRPPADYRGSIFGRLTVIEDDLNRSRPGHRYVLVQCACGVKKSTRLDGLRRGATVSCGCKKAEHNFKHGHRRIGQQDPTYTSWDSMWQRCTNPNTPAYPHYGGRGITVDQKWKDFSAFLQDMGERPSLAYEIDRKDNDQGYCKDNCKWSTRREQMMNTRRVVTVLWNGQPRALRDLAIEHGMDPLLVQQRYRNGWTAKEALTVARQRRS